LGVITISRGCFERCYSQKKTPPFHSNLSFVTLRNRRPTLLHAPAYCTPSEASPRRQCGHASWSKRKPIRHAPLRQVHRATNHPPSTTPYNKVRARSPAGIGLKGSPCESGLTASRFLWRTYSRWTTLKVELALHYVYTYA